MESFLAVCLFFPLSHSTLLSPTGWCFLFVLFCFARKATMWFPILSAPSSQHEISEKTPSIWWDLTSIFKPRLYEENRYIKNVSLQVNWNRKLKCHNICLYIQYYIHTCTLRQAQRRSTACQPYPSRATVREWTSRFK